MRGPWLRLYTEIIDDPKVWTLPAAQFRIWIGLLCIASEHGGALPSSETIAYRLRCSRKSIDAALASLASAGLIDRDQAGKMALHNWSQRQYVSDVSTPRVRRYRQRERSSTPPQPPAAANAPAPADDVIERMMRRHPRPDRAGSAAEIGRALVSILQDSANMAEEIAAIERKHQAWCESAAWTEHDGRYCPSLPRWILTGKCFTPPPAPAQSEYINARHLHSA